MEWANLKMNRLKTLKTFANNIYFFLENRKGSMVEQHSDCKQFKINKNFPVLTTAVSLIRQGMNSLIDLCFQFNFVWFFNISLFPALGARAREEVDS